MFLLEGQESPGALTQIQIGDQMNFTILIILLPLFAFTYLVVLPVSLAYIVEWTVHYWFRTPQFMEMMKASLNGALDLKRMARDGMNRVHERAARNGQKRAAATRSMGIRPSSYYAF